MAWRDQLGKVKFAGGRELVGASFRGVPFHVESAELGGGRRTVTHEFPLRDDQFVEDLGRRARSFPVDGYVLGAQYLTYRDALLAALEQAGPGELAHPFYGSLLVICTGFRVRESPVDGGLARFSIDFEETEAKAKAPVEVVAADDTVAAAADAAWAAEREALLAKYTGTGMPATAMLSAEQLLAQQLEAQYGALAPFITGVQELAKLKQRMDAIIENAYSLVRKPAELLNQLEAMFVSIATLPLTATLGVRALISAYEINPREPRPPASTSTRAIEQANYDALLQIIRSLMVIQAARLATAETYDSYDAAVAVRDSVGEKLDLQAEASEDDSFTALSQLRVDLVRALPGEASDLPRLVRFTPVHVIPSLVLAHQLYGDASREADLVLRNRVPRPGFVQGGTELEVLTRG